MKAFNVRVGIVVASLSLATAPAFAQKPTESGGGGPAAGAADRATGGGGPAGGGGGGAVDRGSGGGGGGSVASSGGSASSGSSGGGFSSNSPSANAISSPSSSFGSGSFRESAPRHRAGFNGGGGNMYAYDESGQKATPRSSGPSGGSGSSGGTAVTRGGGSSSGGGSGAGAGARSNSGSGDNARTPSRTRTASEASTPSNNATGTREVPTWSRPRGDRPTTGTAVERTVPAPDRNGNYRDRYGYYDPYGFGYGYGNGFGNGYYSCFSCYPYGFGMGYGLYSGFGWAPYYGDPLGDPYGSYGYGGGSSMSYGRGEQGNLKLKVKPRAAKVYVDGYFVGFVEQFDGAFQKLALNTGRHKVEIKADGFETAEFDVLINAAQTVTFQGDLKRIQ